MAELKNRSLSDLQRVRHPSLKQSNDNDTYRMMVLRFDESEEEVDRHFLQTALELGIKPKTAPDLVTNDVSTININDSSPEPPISSPSLASGWTHAASDSSLEQQKYRKTPSLTATSITSVPSVSSASSRKSIHVKVKKGFRRISTLRKWKTLAVPVPALPAQPSAIKATRLDLAIRPGMQPRPVTLDQAPQITHPQPHALTTDLMHPRAVPPRRAVSVAYNAPQPIRPTTAPPPPSSSPSPEPCQISSNATAIARSLSNPNLKMLRTLQLQEQLRFISFEASQHRLMRTKQLQQKRDSLSAYKTLQETTEARHAEALASLEHRHLSAEVDLNKTLKLDRQACDTKLKHMQAYCNPRSTVAGMPDRVVTRSDYRQLEQQYHVRNGIDNLHTSRINVLREKQGKQLERITAKQEAEIETLESDFETQNEYLDVRFDQEEKLLHQEFSERKKRLVARWDLAEAIERKKLELGTGEEYGPLPPCDWRDGAEGSGRQGKVREGAEQGPNPVYNAMNMI